MSNTLGCVPIAGIAVPSHLQKERANCATNGTIGTGDCPNGLVAINNIGGLVTWSLIHLLFLLFCMSLCVCVFHYFAVTHDT